MSKGAYRPEQCKKLTCAGANVMLLHAIIANVSPEEGRPGHSGRYDDAPVPSNGIPANVPPNSALKCGNCEQQLDVEPI